MLKSYPLNILKAQSESSDISNLGQIFIFTENSTPYYPYESFWLPPNYCPNQCFWRTSKYLFPAKIPDPKLSSQPPPVFLTIECPPGYASASFIFSFHCIFGFVDVRDLGSLVILLDLLMLSYSCSSPSILGQFLGLWLGPKSSPISTFRCSSWSGLLLMFFLL